MVFWRPFRRAKRDLGTLGGNPSELDEVEAEGPPVFSPTPAGLEEGINYWDAERSAALQGDMARDLDSEFTAATDAENAAWDALAGEADSPTAERAPDPPPEPDDFNLA